MQTVFSIGEWIAKFVAFGADLATLALGGIALWTLFFHKKKVALLIEVVLASFFNARVQRVRETLGKLESTNFDEKETRPKIFSLIGQVSGQIKPFAATSKDLHGVHVELIQILAKKVRLTEAHKQRLVSEMHAGLDSTLYAKSRALMEDAHE